MKTNDLLTIWSAPDPPRLTPKQVSIRLPIIVSAKISALLDLYPKKTKTDIISDLLITALDKLEDELPMKIIADGSHMKDESGEYFHEFCGIRKDYYNLTEKYLREIEKEAGIEEPMEYSIPNVAAESEFKWE